MRMHELIFTRNKDIYYEQNWTDPRQLSLQVMWQHVAYIRAITVLLFFAFYVAIFGWSLQ